MATKRTYCRICEASCGLLAEVHDDRVIELRPDRDHPVSRGYVCAKGTRFTEVAYHPRRLTRPMIREDGALKPASWKQAIARAAEGFMRIRREHGPHAVAVYFGNPLAFNAKASLTLPALLDALGTRNVFGAGSQDCNNKFVASRIAHGSEVIQPFPDFAHCDLAVVLGSNPLVSQSSFVHLEGGARVFDELVARGGQVVWIDPRRTESAERWGDHLAITPGSDAWLLMALLRRLGGGTKSHPRVSGLDEVLAACAQADDDRVSARTGLSVASIDELAARIRNADRVAFHLSVGVNIAGFGTLCSMLLTALAWVTGNFDREGGLLVHPWAHWLAKAYRLSGMEDRAKSRVGGFGSVLGTLPAGVLADEIDTDGPDRVRALLCIAGDPAQSVPGARLDDAIAGLEHVVTIDMFENATGRHADVLLPTTSWLERWDAATASMLFQRGGLLQAAGPVVPPVGECRHDAAIAAELAKAMGVAPLMAPLRFDIDRWMPAGRYGLPQPKLTPGRWLADHDLRLWDPRLDAEVTRLVEAAPREGDFRLLTRRRRLGHNSWLHGATRDGDAERVAWIGAEDMAALGIADGDEVEVRTSEGSVALPARTREGVARRTVVIPHGLPGLNVNAIIPSGPEAIERLSGNLRMTGIEAQVLPASPA